MLLTAKAPVSAALLLVLGLWALLGAVFHADPLEAEQGHDMLIQSSPLKYKVVLIVLDAFRLDYYHRFGLMAKYVKDHPQKARLLQMKAQAPTMTAERIQAMMSGTELSAPSFLANFLSSKSTVDSIPQRVANSSLLLGDDTWEKLYGFSKTVPCSSFDVADFDSCDRAVTDHIFDGLSRNYSFIVGHMLGLDHIGHTYASTRVWRIDDKLDEMEDFLEKLIEAIDQKTILLVAGDHGMKSDGNHGGGTDTERNTALMFFSHNKGFMLPTQTIPWHSQTSLAPTLALFLNVSVPANTLAEPLYEILPDEFLPYRSEIESNARNIIRKSLIKRGVVFSPGNEVQAAKQVKQTVAELQLCLGILLLSASYVLLSYSTQTSLLEHLAIFSFPLLNFSWGLMKSLSTVCSCIFIGAILIRTIIVKKPLRVLIVSIVTVFLMAQLQPNFEADQYQPNFLTISAIAQFNTYKRFLMILKIVVCAVMVLQTLRRSNESRLFNRTVQLCLSVLLLAEEVMRVFNIYKYWLRILILICVLGCWLFVPSQTRKESVVYVYFLIAIFGGPSGYVLLFLQLFLQQEFISNFKDDDFTPIFLAMLAELTWLMQGNRPNFSSLDIRNSYVLSRQFSIFLNGFSMWFYLMATNLLAITPCLLQDQLLCKQGTNKNNQTEPYKKAAIKFCLVSLANILTAAIGVYFNISKILFTVVYVPLLVFVAGKSISLFFIIGIHRIINKINSLRDYRQKGQGIPSEQEQK